MTTPKPLLPLTPTERRIVEVAFAIAAHETVPMMKAWLALKLAKDLEINRVYDSDRITMPKGVVGVMFVFESKERAREVYGEDARPVEVEVMDP